MRPVLSSALVLIFWLPPTLADEQRTFCGKTVEGWREAVRDKTWEVGERRQAVWALGCFGPEAKAAVPDLIELVQRGQFEDEAIGALIAIEAHPELAVPRLIETYVKEGCRHRTAMGAIGFNAGTEDALVHIGGPAVPALINILNGQDRDMRVCAAAALGRIGLAARPAIPDLIQAASSPEKDYLARILRRHAVIALGQIGPEARAIAPTLKRWLEGEPQGNLGWPGPEQPDVVTTLTRIGFPPVSMLVHRLLEDDSRRSAWELAGLGSNAREAIPALRGALTDKRLPARVYAAIALVGIDPNSVETVPVLTEALNHPDEEIPDSWVINALATLGPKARVALPALIGLAGKECDQDLCKAIVRIDPDGKACIPTLISVLKNEDYQLVHVAADCLGLLGPRAKDAIPALAASLTREFGEGFANGYEPQASAARALRRIGPEARSAIPALIRALKFRDHVRANKDPFNQLNGPADQSDSTARKHRPRCSDRSVPKRGQQSPP